MKIKNIEKLVANLHSHKKFKEYVKIKIFVMPSEDTNILEFNKYQKSGKAQFIYADLECLIEKIDGSKIILKIYPHQK